MTPVPKAQKAAVDVRVLVKAPRDAVLEAFRDPSRLQQWYFEDASLDFRPGGRFVFRGIEGEVAGVLSEAGDWGFEFAYAPPWWGTVRVELLDDAKGTRVRVRHAGFEGREEWVQRFTWGWEAHLRNLKSFLEGRKVK